MKNKKPVNFLQQQRQEGEDKIVSKKQAIFFGAIAIIAIFFLTKLSLSALPSSASSDPKDYDPVTLEPKESESMISKLGQLVFDKNEELAGQNEDRINLLLLGMGGVGHDGPYLTDTIMVASIKPSTGEVGIVSIPRDLQVDIPDYGKRKINHANAFGESEKENWGGAFTTKVVENNFDINIHYYARIDFKAFTKLVDEIGGIKVDVEYPFTDSQYPAPNDKYQTISFKSGVQNMDGERALKFARSRHGNNNQGSDFSRARRQQKVMLAAKKKVLSFETLTNPSKIHDMMTTLEEHLTTNMKFSEIISFVKLGKELNIKNISTLVLDSGPDGFLQSSTNSQGAFILRPKSGNFDKINKAIDNIFTYEKAEVANNTPKQTEPKLQAENSNINIEIQNGTWRAGLAARTKKDLEQESLAISDIGNTSEKPIKTSGIYTLDTSKDLADHVSKIQTETSMPIKKELPKEIKASTSTDIILILGKDYKQE